MQFGTCIIYNANFVTIKQDNFKISLQNKHLCFVCTMLTIYLKSVFHLIKTFYLLLMFVLFLIQTTNLFYLIIGMKLSALKKYSFLLISLSIWAMQKVFPLRPECMNSSLIPTSLMKSSRQVIH